MAPHGTCTAPPVSIGGHGDPLAARVDGGHVAPWQPSRVHGISHNLGFFSPPGLFSLGSNPVVCSPFLSLCLEHGYPWQNHQTHRRKILRSGGAQHGNTSYGQRILTRSTLSTDPATETSPVNWTPHGFQSNGMSWSNERLRELARSRRERTSPPAHLQCQVPHLFHHSSRNSQTSPHWCVRQLQRPWRGYLNGWPC